MASLRVSVLALLLVLASACGGDDEATTEEDLSGVSQRSVTMDASEEMEIFVEDPMAMAVTTTMAMAQGAATSASAESAAQETEEGGPLAVATAAAPSDYGRDVIYRARILVHAADVGAATREAVAIVQGLGGIVFGQQIRTRPEAHAEITFKVLPEDFSLALERLAGVGELVDQQITADDVTDRIVNFESRILTAETSVNRLRRFLNEATDLDNVALLERELLHRETDLETLRGQLRTLQDQVGLATITLSIAELPAVEPLTGMRVTAWAASTEEDPCLGVQDIVVGPEDTVYFCLEIENTGEAPITSVKVHSDALRLRSDTRNRFMTVQGGFDRIEPGEWLVATLAEPIVDGRLAGRVATRGLEVGFDVLATPIRDDGRSLDDVSGSYWLSVFVEEDDSLTFSSALRAGADGVVALFSFLGVLVGLILPFLPIVAPLVVLAWWLRRRSNTKKQPDQTSD